MEYHIDPILKAELDKIKKVVRENDRDYVMVIDGEEGSGKSVLALQICKYLDSTFNADDITFNADQFLDRLKKNKKFKANLLDEAFSSANARASLSEVNRAMIGVATEVRQKNQFIVLCLPSFFDLDKYFALWRCRCLLHVYFRDNGTRGSYIIFPKTVKKLLYLYGKKTYDYSKPASPYPPCSFTNFYPIDEAEYRSKKADAFKKRVVSNLAKRWKSQRDALVKELYHFYKASAEDIARILIERKVKSLTTREIFRILEEKEAKSSVDEGESEL